MAARKKSEEPSINIDEVLTDEELKAVANESEPAERKAKPEDGPRTVVVAEDEAVNRMDLVAMLEDNGYEVVGQAANGEEAVELTRKYRPDVVCMDVKDSQIVMQPEEVVDFCWVDESQYRKMEQDGLLHPALKNFFTTYRDKLPRTSFKK